MKKEKASKTKEIKVSLLNDEYSVVVCWGGVKYVAKILKAWGFENFDVERELDTRRGICFYNKGCHPVIALPKRPRTPEEIGTLAHESTHAVENVFNNIGETLGGEVFAHCVGAIVRKVLSTK